MIKSIFAKIPLLLVGILLGIAMVAGGAAFAAPQEQATAVDLNAAIGKGAARIGMPRHGAWCTNLTVPADKQTQTQASFSILSWTEIRVVSNNYGEYWVAKPEYGTSTGGTAFTVSGTTGKVTFKYGLSGTVKVCYGPVAGASLWGKFGIGTAPTDKLSVNHFLPDVSYERQKPSGGHHSVLNFYMQVDADATKVTFNRHEGTQLRAWVRYQNAAGKWISVPLGLPNCTVYSCTLTLPENVVFGDFASKPSILVSAWWDEALLASEPDYIGIDQ